MPATLSLGCGSVGFHHCVLYCFPGFPAYMDMIQVLETTSIWALKAVAFPNASVAFPYFTGQLRLLKAFSIWFAFRFRRGLPSGDWRKTRFPAFQRLAEASSARCRGYRFRAMPDAR